MASKDGHSKIKAPEQYKFSVGDKVVWNTANQQLKFIIANCRKDHGDRAFIVRKVENIPHNKKWQDLRKAVGHDQFVWLKTIEIKFSGALFQRFKK